MKHWILYSLALLFLVVACTAGATGSHIKEDALRDIIKDAIEQAMPDVQVVKVEREVQVLGPERVVEVPAKADDTAAFAYTYLDDGGCKRAGHTYSGEYEHDDKANRRNVTAYVRAAPTGGDCVQEGLTYSLDIEQGFAWRPGIEGLVKFMADSRSVSAPYGLGDGMGGVLLRPDGVPYFGTILPAGKRQAVAAVLGASFLRGSCEFDTGLNVVPVDWSSGDKGRTVHLGLSCERKVRGAMVELTANADVGEGAFWDLVFSVDRQFSGSRFGVGVVLRYAGGLNDLDGGEPGMQTVGGAPFMLLGAPQDTVFGIEARIFARL